MDGSEFSDLVRRLERQADETPRLYALRVALIAALGYAPIALGAVVTLVAGALCIASVVSGSVSQLAVIGTIAGAVMTFAIVRGALVSIDPPVGRTIARDEAPSLFAAIDDVLQRTASLRSGSHRSGGTVLAGVTLDAAFHVSLHQQPRWGVFGRYSCHLQLGIPLLATLDVVEFKTMLAHELGHLGRRDSRFAAWIYRQRVPWQALQRKFAEPAGGAFEKALALFYRGYAPYFHAHTFVLARQHEYHADQVAAWATEARVFGRALVKADLAARFLTEIFWERFYAQVEKAPEPPYLPYAMLPRALSIARREWLREDWLQASLRRFASDADAHPSLAERLTALSVPAELPASATGSTALHLLGALAPALLQWCDDEWRAENAAAWRKRHEAIREARWKIAQYENTPAEELKPADLWEKSLLLLDVGHEPAAIEELRALVLLEPSFAQAHFLLGRLLLESGDEAGMHNLTLAAQQDEELLTAAGQLGYGYLLDRGRKGEAQRFWDRCRSAA